jgi:hypothetical protein
VDAQNTTDRRIEQTPTLLQSAAAREMNDGGLPAEAAAIFASA